MKKLFYSILAIAAAFAVNACVEAPVEEVVENGNAVTVNFVAGVPGTRTAFTAPTGDEEDVYPVLWTSKDEAVKVSVNGSDPVDAAVIPAKDFKTAKFQAELVVGEAPYNFELMSPASAFIIAQNGNWLIDVPTVQTPVEGSVDEAAQILVASSKDNATLPESVNVTFKHWTAYGKFVLVNVGSSPKAPIGPRLMAPKSIVTITAAEPLAGVWEYTPADGTSSVSKAAHQIMVKPSSLDEVWFACAPADLSGKKIQVSVDDGSVTYVKEITLPANSVFEAGKVVTATVDMSGAVAVEAKTYERIDNPRFLTDGSEVVIAAASPNHNFAIGNVQNSSNRSAAAVMKSGTTLVPSSDVEIFELSVKGDQYLFRAKSIVAPGYLAGVKDGQYLRTSASADDAAWEISLKPNNATIKSVASGNVIRYNSSSSLFTAVNATSNIKDTVAIYKVVGSGDKLTLTEDDFSVTPSEIAIKISETAKVEYTITSDFDGTVELASSDDNIITVAADGTVTPVAGGEATVKVIASGSNRFSDCTIEVPVKVSVLTFARVWGKYPIAEGKAWTTEYSTTGSFLVGNDRTMAADNENVYVAAASSSTKGILAINLLDPTKIKEVNITGVEGGFFATACVRTIYDPTTQKYILLAGTLAHDSDCNFKVYAWKDGIDNAPSVLISWNTNNGSPRRIGDFFNVVGDWSNGEVWARLNKSGSQSTTFMWKITNGVAGTVLGGAMGYAGAAGMGQIYKYNVAAKRALLVTPTIGRFFDYKDNDGWLNVNNDGVNWAGIDNSVMARKFGITPFTYDGTKYIAYVKKGMYDNSGNAARARIKVIADQGSADTFLATMEADQVIYEAPIQNSNNATTAAQFNEVYFTGNPSIAGQEMANCSVVPGEDCVYLVGHLYNVGVSVFKLSYEVPVAEE